MDFKSIKMSLYIISTAGWPENKNNKWQRVFDEIKKISPDYIVTISNTEYDIEIIFKDLFDKLQRWLELNNKLMTVITPQFDGIYLRKNIITEKSFGMVTDCTHQLLHNNYHTSLSIIPDLKNIEVSNFEKLYTCYNNNAKTHRIKLIDELAKENLLDDGIVTFRYPENINWKYHSGIRLVDEDDYTIHSKPNYHPNAFPMQFYKGLFDITCETSFEYTHITEKTLKNIILFKPFLSLSCKKFHKEYIQNYFGFKLYDELFDYSFDDHDSLDKRIFGIIENTKKLKKLNIHERYELYKSIVPKLIYNKNRLIELLYDKKKIIPKCLQFLTKENHIIYGTHDSLITHMHSMGWIT